MTSEDQNVEYHHIFPKKLLDARGVEHHTRNEMANIAFLGQKANGRTLATEPKVYFVEIAVNAPERIVAQFVPMDRSLW